MRSILTLAALACLTTAASAAPTVFSVSLNGANETNGMGVFNLGDLNAFGSGTLTIDPDTDMISWDIAYTDVDGTSLTGFHVHGPDATLATNKPVFIGFPTTPGMLPNGSLVGSQAADSARLDAILANPAGFYLNVHTSSFPGGAIRGQIPEPASMAIAGGFLGALAMRRQRRA